MNNSNGQARGVRFSRIGAWLSGAFLALGLLSFAGASAASAAPTRGVLAQATCPTDPYTGVTTQCNNGSTVDTAGSGNANGTNTGTANNGGGGSLASTGADILMAILAAVLLILLGTTIILAARQRRQTA